MRFGCLLARAWVVAFPGDKIASGAPVYTVAATGQVGVRGRGAAVGVVRVVEAIIGARLAGGSGTGKEVLEV